MRQLTNVISHFKLELETTMRQECEAKLTLTSTNYESKIATLEKELEEAREKVGFAVLTDANILWCMVQVCFWVFVKVS